MRYTATIARVGRYDAHMRRLTNCNQNELRFVGFTVVVVLISRSNDKGEHCAIASKAKNAALNKLLEVFE